MESQWLVVYTSPKTEKKIYERLLKIDVNAFLPLQTVTRQWSDRKKIVEIPLFPNYLFVNISQKERWKVLSQPGVIKFLSHNGVPCLVPEKQISAIQNLICQREVELCSSYLIKGQRVMIVKGPLTGFEGLLIEKKGKMRLVIEICSLFQSICVDVCESYIEKICG
jgi:transcription antitermination factor NusG